LSARRVESALAALVIALAHASGARAQEPPDGTVTVTAPPKEGEVPPPTGPIAPVEPPVELTPEPAPKPQAEPRDEPVEAAAAAGDADVELKPVQESSEPEERETFGAIDPGKGFEVANTRYGDLRVSGYALVRYLNQLPENQSFVDHLDRRHVVDTRNDIQFHRVLFTFTGWMYDPDFNYAVTMWTVNSTTQVNIVGWLSYTFGRAATLYGGVGGLPGTRSLQGSHPYWLAHDRVMADEYFRPGFTMGLWLTGEPIDTLFYTAMIGNNLSTLGITAREDTRQFAGSGSIWWQPTTGEFGPRGGFGDYEDHERLATRFGTSFTHSRENRYSDLSQRSPDNTQIRISDSLLLFEADALAEGVTVNYATYDLWAIDAGFKYRGFFLQAEYYLRWLWDFDATGPLPLDEIFDHGFYVQTSYMVLPELLELYAATSHVFGEFRDSHEVLGGGNLFPFDTRNLRLNAQVIGVDRSPASSLFGFYVGGQKGVTVSAAASVFF
jgi:hypothetical protein